MSIPRILHYPGSKWSMSDWIISHMPKHLTYLEPYFGSGAIFFNKERSNLETINDLDTNVVNLFTMIRTKREELAELIRWTPFSRDEYYAAYEHCEDDLERARRFLVRCWLARGGKTSDRTGWRHNIDITKSPNRPPVKQWLDLPQRILDISERLQGVQIESQTALKLIDRYKRPSVLIYADPPYLLSTRSKRMYKHEMTEDEHRDLLDVLDDHPGPVLLSGYAHPIYDERLKHWERDTKIVVADGGKTRTEVLWINPIAAKQSAQLNLFDCLR